MGEPMVLIMLEEVVSCYAAEEVVMFMSLEIAANLLAACDFFLPLKLFLSRDN